MRYDVKRRHLRLGTTHCRACRKGKVPTKLKCPRCAGSGDGPRGGRNGCTRCYGNGHVYDHDNLSTCGECGGEYHDKDMERWTDHVPTRFCELVPIRVIRVDRDNTWNESHLGFGTLWSAMDYGKAFTMDDEDLLDAVRRELIAHPPQGSKVTVEGDDPLQRKVASGLVIAVTRTGYALRAEGLVTRPGPEPRGRRPQQSIRVGTTEGVCETCHLIHVPGECLG
jgi:hypothetical protein